MEKAIVIAMDDIINDMQQTLHHAGISYDKHVHSLSDPFLKKQFYDLRNGNLSEIAKEAFTQTKSIPEAISFIHNLADSGFQIILSTDRDLRFCYDITENWLKTHHVFYDYLFWAHDLVKLCHECKISFLICHTPNRLKADHSIHCFCPTSSAPSALAAEQHSFFHFEEVENWLQNFPF